GVDPDVVDQVRQEHGRAGVGHADLRAPAGHALVLRLLGAEAGVRPFRDRHQLAAGHRAGPAGIVLPLEVAADVLAVDLLVLREDAGGVVLDRQPAAAGRAAQAAGRAGG